jgi:hypothetical protein
MMATTRTEEMRLDSTTFAYAASRGRVGATKQGIRTSFIGELTNRQHKASVLKSEISPMLHMSATWTKTNLPTDCCIGVGNWLEAKGDEEGPE